MIESIRIPVSGMTCAACQARVQRTLQKQPGVSDATVNLMMHDATVRFDAAAISATQLVEAIRDSGYGAELAAPDQSAFDEQAALDDTLAAEFRALRVKAITTASVGVVAMILSMPIMSRYAQMGHDHTGSGTPAVADPFMRWVDDGSWTPHCVVAIPALYAIDARWLTWVLLALTVGVMLWAGRDFYTRAWAAARHRAADMNTLVAVGHGCGLHVLVGGDCRTRVFSWPAAWPPMCTTKPSLSSSRSFSPATRSKRVRSGKRRLHFSCS